MKKGRSFTKLSEKRDSGRFVSVPISVLNSKAYLDCNAHARMLLWDLFVQYGGFNNGDLCAAWKVMKKRGWRSEETLNRAKQRLLEVQLIVETRKGARPNKASLYAVTWCDLDDCGGKLDIGRHAFPRGAYKLRDPAPPLKPMKNASLATERVA